MALEDHLDEGERVLASCEAGDATLVCTTDRLVRHRPADPFRPEQVTSVPHDQVATVESATDWRNPLVYFGTVALLTGIVGLYLVLVLDADSPLFSIRYQMQRFPVTWVLSIVGGAMLAGGLTVTERHEIEFESERQPWVVSDTDDGTCREFVSALRSRAT